MDSIKYPGQHGKLLLVTVIALVSFLFLIAFTPNASAAAGVRFLHLAPDAGSFNIWIDGRLIEQDLKFKENTEYVELNPGQHRVICKTNDGPNPQVLNSPFPFREDKEYTVSVTGNREGGDLQLVFVIDNCPPARSLAQVKFTNAVQNSPPADLSIKYGPTLYSDMAFRASGSCQLIPPDNYIFRLSETESGDLIAEKKVELKAGTRHNIFATNSQKGGSTDLISLEKPNAPEEVPKIFGVERSVLQVLGAGLIASLLILALGR